METTIYGLPIYVTSPEGRLQSKAKRDYLSYAWDSFRGAAIYPYIIREKATHQEL